MHQQGDKAAGRNLLELLLVGPLLVGGEQTVGPRLGGRVWAMSRIRASPVGAA